jgi:hypothetical protein
MKSKRTEKKAPKKKRRKGYVAPKVETYSSREIVDSLGPAQGLMSGVSPDCDGGGSSQGGSHRGHH